MPQYRFDIQQNTEEWFAAKAAMFSASSADALLMAKSTSGYTNLIDKIIEERITGTQAEGRWGGNASTERGHEFEPIAAADFELNTFIETQVIGIVIYDDWTVCSPDRLIGDDGLLQIKCPLFKTQREYLKKKKVPGNYYKQMQFELMVTGRNYNRFYSFHPKLPAVDIIVDRDEAMIQMIMAKLAEAKQEVIREVQFLKSLK